MSDLLGYSSHPLSTLFSIPKFLSRHKYRIPARNKNHGHNLEESVGQIARILGPNKVIQGNS